MQLTHIFTDDRAVSPVIGVILMVGITVILAATVGSFVLNIGAGQEAPPQVSWDVAETVDGGSVTALTVTHDGGASVESGLLRVAVGGDSVDLADGTRLTAGSTFDVALDGAGDGYDSGTTVLVVYSPDGKSDTTVLGRHRLTTSTEGTLDGVTIA